MRIRLLAVGTRLPVWVETGFAEYARRMPPQCRLELVEIAAEKRRRYDSVARLKQAEAKRILGALHQGERLIALDEGGSQWSSKMLSRQLDGWMGDGQDVALLVGGPDGLDRTCLDRAGQRWSLSTLTLPHALVRIVVAEQLYRAWSISTGHPYHRE